MTLKEIWQMKRHDIYIVAAKRTPIGSFGGALCSIPAPKLGSIAIQGAIKQAGIDKSKIDEVLFGNVLQANIGQAPAKQASILSGISQEVPCTTINKVCASAMKAATIGAQSIANGDNDIVVVGGMENMSQVPHYLPKVRTGQKLGDLTLIDGMIKDGLTDPYDSIHMGVCAEYCAEKYGFSREDQDRFALESYARAKEAWAKNKFAHEIVSVPVPQRRGNDLLISEDQEYKNIKEDKISDLKPVFKKQGTVTVANASTLNDGAAALILMSDKKIKEFGVTPLAKIIGYADASLEPKWFTVAPEKAVRKSISKANLTLKDIDYFELNEAFSVVGLANTKLLGVCPDRVNIHGGAVALGHPLGCSGARILVTLVYVLKQNKAKYGIAGICNGGGGASAIAIENLSN